MSAKLTPCNAPTVRDLAARVKHGIYEAGWFGPLGVFLFFSGRELTSSYCPWCIANMAAMDVEERCEPIRSDGCCLIAGLWQTTPALFNGPRVVSICQRIVVVLVARLKWLLRRRARGFWQPALWANVGRTSRPARLKQEDLHWAEQSRSRSAGSM